MLARTRSDILLLCFLYLFIFMILWTCRDGAEFVTGDFWNQSVWNRPTNSARILIWFLSCLVKMVISDMEKGADAQTLTAEIYGYCGNYLAETPN